MGLILEIVGSDFPEADFRVGETDYRDLHLAFQSGREYVSVYPIRDQSYRTTLEIQIVASKTGSAVFRGSLVHGPSVNPHLYLVWLSKHPTNGLEMFRRGKIMLKTLPQDIVGQAVDKNVTLQITLALKDTKGEPICATIHPPHIQYGYVG